MLQGQIVSAENNLLLPHASTDLPQLLIPDPSYPTPALEVEERANDTTLEDLPLIETIPLPDDETSFADSIAQSMQSIWEGWHGSIDLGMSGSQGNSQNMNINGNIRAKYKGLHAVHSYGLSFQDRKNRDRVIARRGAIDMRIEWPLPDSKLSYFISGRNEYDSKKSFEYRVNAISGIGYEIFSTEIGNMVARFGGSISREIGVAGDPYIPEVSSSLDWHRKWGPLSDLGMELEYIPSVIEGNEFRLNSTIFYVVRIHPDWKMRIKFSVTDRYENNTVDKYQNDLDYAAALSWKY